MRNTRNGPLPGKGSPFRQECQVEGVNQKPGIKRGTQQARLLQAGEGKRVAAREMLPEV